METKYVRVPFDIEMAKKITNGEVEGRVVTRDGRSVRILCFDRKGKSPIITLVLVDGNEEGFTPYLLDGRLKPEKEDRFDLMLEIPEYMTYKDRDILISADGCDNEMEKCEDIENESIKNDRKDDKVMMELLPWPELEEVGKVYTAGAKKYGPNKWKNLPDGYQRYKGAMLRHLTELEKGNDIDPETGCLHAAQIVWNAIAMLHCKMEEMSLKNNVCNG